MVNKLLCFFIMLLLPISLRADFANSDIFITSSIDDGAYANQPFTGTLSITHDQKQKIDTSSFQLASKPITAEFVQDVKISSNSPIVITYYQFQMPAQPAGLYMLPEMTVKIDGKQYRSIMSSYEVKGGAPSSAPPTGATSAPKPAAPLPTAQPQAATPNSSATSQPPAKIILKLEASAVPDKLYPGQKSQFIYRYYFNTNISLSKEELPLLDAEGFLKFGDKEAKDSTENNMSVREVSQTVEAKNPGTFVFGPSIIEGYSYTQKGKGDPVYSSSVLSSEVQKVIVTVLPFPEEGKPSSFNGAVGKFDFKSTLASSTDIHIGDEISLNIDISGKGDLSGVALPDISKQPGFNGFFRMSDLPPVGSVDGDIKHFSLSMRPIAEVKEIPSIEFSFFNPDIGKYTTVNAKAIPISIKPVENVQTKSSQEIKSKAAAKPKDAAPVNLSQSKPIEIEGSYSLQTADLYNKVFGTWLVLGMIPFGLALWFYQITLRDYLERVKHIIIPETSREVYASFLQQKKGSSRYYELLAKTLKLKLKETGHLANADVSSEHLPIEGISGEVRIFLNEIEESRFSRTGKLIPDSIESRAQALMQQMEKQGSSS